MRFKLLHVRPHIWLFKQQETQATKASIDDSSCDGPLVYKRSTSLKLVKSDPSAASSCKGGESPSDGKPASLGTAVTSKHVQKKGKNVQVCTVVDAGCTCRATVTSQHKQKTALGSSIESSRDGGSLHDVCRPRRSHVSEAKEPKYDGVASKHANLHSKSTSSSSRSPGTNGSMVSRLVCKSSNDVIKHTKLDTEQNHVICKSPQDEGLQLNTVTEQVRDSELNTTQVDVHELECRLRNAGLEQKRRNLKKNKLHYEEDSLTSSDLSSSLSTSGNTETVQTTTTSEMQDMLLSSNPAFDMDVLTLGSHVMSLDDLRESIAQRKLASLSPPASLSTGSVGLTDGLKENSACTISPSSFSSENLPSARAILHQCLQKPSRCSVDNEKLEVTVKHVVGVNKRRSFSECDDAFNQGLVKQSQRGSSTMHSKVKEATRNDKTPSRRSARKIGRGVQMDTDVNNVKSRVSRCLTHGERHGLNRNTHANQANSKEADIDTLALDGGVLGYPQSDSGQEKQMVSSSSCEIQVLSDYNYENHSGSGHKYPMLRIHVGGASSMSDSVDAGTSTLKDHGAIGHELVSSESAVAMVKSSYDPRRDFKESMLEMVAAKRLRAPCQLQQLLQCYLSLNPSHYHPIIIKVFHELCSELFQ
ncbi:hypothetical protein L7F22_041100 [Adiantum nelumboides]|nr:hypothetical protein [Adiantum nelumboides]